MTDSPPNQNSPASDLAATIAFLMASPAYIEALTEEDLPSKFSALPNPARRLILNFAGIEWSDVIARMREAGVEDQNSLDTIRPLVERFRPLAIRVVNRARARKELQKEYSGVGAIRPMYLFEMATGIPILRLQFLDEDEKVLFESRETTPGMMGNAHGIMVAVAQSFEYCRERKLSLPRYLPEYIKEVLTDLLGEVKRIAIALNIPESQLLDALSGSNSPEKIEVEKGVEGE